MTITRLTGGLTPGDGSDPRTFPAIFNATADEIEATEATVLSQGSAISSQGSAIDALEALNPVQFGTAVPTDGQVLAFSTAVSAYVPEDIATGLVAVKSALFSGTQVASSVASSANVAVTDLSITHEVSNASNKLIISAFLGAAASDIGLGAVGIAVHDGTGLIGVGATVGSRTSTSAGGFVSASTANTVVTMPSITFVHTPGAGSKTFTVRALNISTSTTNVYINRRENDVDNAGNPRAVSALVIQEVSV